MENNLFRYLSGKSEICLLAWLKHFLLSDNNDPKLLRFCIASFCDWSRKRHSLNQSDAKLQRITIWSLTFSRALSRLVGFTPSSDWLLNLFYLLLIARCNNDTHRVINDLYINYVKKIKKHVSWIHKDNCSLIWSTNFTESIPLLNQKYKSNVVCSWYFHSGTWEWVN